MGSIRSFLTYALVGSVGFAILLAIIISYQRTTHETEELYDAELAQVARLLESVLSIEFEYTGQALQEQTTAKLIRPPEIHAEGEYDLSGHKYEKKLAFQVWNRKGVPLFGSEASGQVLGFKAEVGYSSELIDQQEWRTFTLYSEPLSVWIKAAQLVEIRDEITHKIAVLNIYLLLGLLPLSLLLITLIVRKGLAPLDAISKEISLRGKANLSALSFRQIPRELNPVIESVNNLMDSLERSFERQKRFTSNAAHELRTPLAAIRIHAQNLYPEDERRQKIQQNIIQGVDKLTHLFNQLITLNRSENLTTQADQSPLAVAALIEEISHSLQATLTAKQIQLQNQTHQLPMLRANPDLLEIILRNLIDNAVKYTPAGGSVLIHYQQQEDGICLLVSDNGPGLNPEQKQQVFERFYRAAGQETEGCGIGLSIVKELCEGCGYRIELLDSVIAPQGLSVRICGLQTTDQTTP